MSFLSHMGTAQQKTSDQSIRQSANTQPFQSIKGAQHMHETLGFVLIVGFMCGVTLVTIIYDLKVKG